VNVTHGLLPSDRADGAQVRPERSAGVRNERRVDSRHIDVLPSYNDSGGIRGEAGLQTARRGRRQRRPPENREPKSHRLPAIFSRR
jgi:hypothetical protein